MLVSSPGGFHPQALSEPDLNLSIHPAPIIQPHRISPLSNGQRGFHTTSFCLLALPFPLFTVPPFRLSVSQSWLTNLQNWITQSLRSTPITGASPLLRTVPPLYLASVLSPSWVLHLWLFPLHPDPGSQVPNRSLYQGHATYMPVTIWTVSRFPPDLSRDI